MLGLFVSHQVSLTSLSGHALSSEGHYPLINIRSRPSSMGPQLERDAVIGRLSVAGPSAAQQKAKDVHEINEKDRMLKRRFFELEEVRYTQHALSPSGEKCVLMAC